MQCKRNEIPGALEEIGAKAATETREARIAMNLNIFNVVST